MRKIGYLAVDHGPRLTLQALASRLPGEWLDPGQGWIEALRAAGVELLICGTSDSLEGRAIEGTACAAASTLGIPTVVLEDFPGNFCAMPGAVPRLLCVESDFAARLAQQKIHGLAVHVGPAIRYDPLRRDLDALRAPNGEYNDDAVLWIGQPETADALRTLGAVMPTLQSTLWFRAHPRDEGYGRGAYARIFDSPPYQVEDTTARALDDCLRRRPRLVITQFSSVAVEAGFWGIPSLNVLLPDAGGGRLREKKGYAQPPWCIAGAAFVVTRCEEIASTLDSAMNSAMARDGVQQRFDEYFKVREPGVPGLISLLYNQRLL